MKPVAPVTRIASATGKKAALEPLEVVDRTHVIVRPSDIGPIAVMGIDADAFSFGEQIAHQAVEPIRLIRLERATESVC